MGHFAKVLDGIVIDVIVAEPEFFEAFTDTSPGEWIQTSYNTHDGIHFTRLEDGGYVPSEDQSKALRKNYAGLGFSYNRELDAFIPPKPFASWILDETKGQWFAPVEFPTGEGPWDWDEATLSWKAIEK